MIGKILGHYQITSQLGKGGMGEVYAGDDLNLNRRVALKFLPEAFAADPERMARFEREARLLASLNHPNIAAIYGLEQAEGKRFIVMELVEGETLAQRISKAPLPIEEALGVCRQITEGLESAHEKGVIHRDLKPANVMLTEGEKVKILDFGLAKAFSDDAQAVDSSQSPTLTEAMTRPGVILGTAAYMSPEQAKGKSVDKRADIWAFGCILYECLTGKKPFEGDTVTETLAAILKSEPDWQALPKTISASIRTLLRRCLQKDLSRRYRDAAGIRIEIDEDLAFPQKSESTVPTPKGRRLTLSLGLTFVGLIAFGFVAAWLLKSSAPSAALTPARVEINLPAGDRLAINRPPVALSPDGRNLVYAAIRKNVQQLFMRSLDSYEVKPILGTEGAEYPFFSPDGEWIGFLTAGKIKKVAIAGGPVQIICDSAGVGGVAWGEDDTVIFSPSAGTAGLMRVSAKGGKAQEFITPDRAKGESSYRWPQFLPGSKALLFTIFTGNGWDEFHIAALRLDTGQKPHVVQSGGLMGRYVPTGHLVYFRMGELQAVPFDPVRLEVADNTPQTIAENVTQSMQTRGADYSFSISGSLAYIPASPRQFERRLVWVDRQGNEEPLPVPEGPYPIYGSIGPSLSPDGRQITVHAESGTSEIGIYDIAREIYRPLTIELSNSPQFPIWTPEGKRITYMGHREGYRNIYLKNADGTGEEEQLTTGENAKIPTSWSRDGKFLSFMEMTATSYDIGILRIDGERKQEPFLSSRFNEYSGQFSPDGRWLAYASDESGRIEVYVRPFDRPGPAIQVSKEGGEVPRWASNGSELFYRNGNKMMAVDIKMDPALALGKSRILFEKQFHAADVARDGRFLMVQPVEPEQPATKINLVLNWFEELKQRVPVK